MLTLCFSFHHKIKLSYVVTTQRIELVHLFFLTKVYKLLNPFYVQSGKKQNNPVTMRNNSTLCT